MNQIGIEIGIRNERKSTAFFAAHFFFCFAGAAFSVAAAAAAANAADAVALPL